jgi:hypothetical protein
MGTRAAHHNAVVCQLPSLDTIEASLFLTNDLRGRVTKLATDVKDALRKCEAMPLFQSATSMSGCDMEEREQHRQLMLKQPLDASLSGLKEATRCELVAYRAKITELSSCLDSLEAHQRQQKQQQQLKTMAATRDGSPSLQQQPSAQALYASVNALGAAVQSTIHHLTTLGEKLHIDDDHHHHLSGDGALVFHSDDENSSSYLQYDDWQSMSTKHGEFVGQAGQSGPPQSIPDSSPLLKPSEHVAGMH